MREARPTDFVACAENRSVWLGYMLVVGLGCPLEEGPGRCLGDGTPKEYVWNSLNAGTGW